jgi:hypothetical protein
MEVSMSRDISISIETGYGLDDRGSIPGRAENFSLRYCVQTGSGAHPASHPVGTGAYFPGGKVAGEWSWRLTSSSAEVKGCVELYLHSPTTSSWRCAYLSTGTTLLLVDGHEWSDSHTGRFTPSVLIG